MQANEERIPSYRGEEGKKDATAEEEKKLEALKDAQPRGRNKIRERKKRERRKEW